MLISKYGNNNTENRINEIEKKFNITLPSEYRNFLCKYNGGDTPDTKVYCCYSKKHQKGVAIVKRLCAENRIGGAYKTSAGWLIPEDAPYPERKPRTLKNKIKFTHIKP